VTPRNSINSGPASFHGLRRILLAALSIAAVHGQVAVVPSYLQDFNLLGAGLPAGWAVWTDSGVTGNGNVFTFSSGAVANNAVASATTYFRNVPGASQSWSSGLSSGSDRGLGWRAGNSSSRDGSITFTLANTVDWTLTSLSFDVFTANSAGTAATFQLQYQLGASGTFLNFSPAVTYTNNIAQSPLIVTSISLTSPQLALLSGQIGPVTLRLDNLAASGTSFNTVVLDNFAYTASAIPEPSTYAVCAGTTILIGAWWRRRRARVPSNARVEVGQRDEGG
jgi:hypothetical protein